ncbi:MAG: alcohol dehydrogenase catalytic domain-containing protein [Gammaproteobacteria bacterium]|jgi:threonine 3-dehydrogenase
MLSIRKIARGAGHLSVDEIDVPEPRPGEVRLKVSAAGICGTDMHIYNWAPFSERLELPTVLGHEICGVVEAAGDGVSRVRVGDFVTVESHIACGNCYSCRTNRSHICRHTRYPGVDIDGGFADYTVLPEQIVIPLPATIDPQAAALFEPFGIAVHASLEGTGVAGANVLITGCGPIGLMNIMAARALGAHKVIATDINPLRLAQAEAAGADVCINPASEDTVRAVNGITNDNGVDVMIEYSGAATSLALAADCITPGGDLRLVGVPGGDTALNLERWLLRGLVVRGIHGRRLHDTWEHAMRLVVDKRVDLTSLVSHVLPLNEGPRGFELIENGEAIKVLFQPT